MADAAIDQSNMDRRQYVMDSEKMVERTLKYLRDIGVADSMEDVEQLVV